MSVKPMQQKLKVKYMNSAISTYFGMLTISLSVKIKHKCPKKQTNYIV